MEKSRGVERESERESEQESEQQPRAGNKSRNLSDQPGAGSGHVEVEECGEGEHQENIRRISESPVGSNILKILRLPDLQKDLQNGAGFNCRVLLGGSSLCRCGFPPENMNLRFNANLILGSRTAVTHCFLRGGSSVMISACVTLSQHAAHISSFFFPLMPPFLRDL